MSGNNNNNNNKDTSDKRDENIFEILDGMMFQLSRTKKMFMIMILTILIIPPVALLVMTATFDQPFHEKIDMHLQEKLERGEITEEEFKHFKEKISDKGMKKKFLLHPPQLLIFAISLGWLGVGIRQWLILTKWDKKYQRFKQRQDEIDKKLEEEDNENTDGDQSNNDDDSDSKQE